MRLKEILALMPHYVEANLPLLLEGEPGTAKSAIVAEVARKTGRKMVTAHFSTWEPTDVAGFPWMGADGEDPDFRPYGIMADLYRETEPTIFFVDEIGQAPLSTQAALMPIVHRDSRGANRRRLPDCVSIVAATNSRKDKAGSNGLITPLQSRFATRLVVQPTVDDFAPWALQQQGLDHRVVAFLFMNPGLLIKNEPTLDLTPCPNLRTWEYAGRLIPILTAGGMGHAELLDPLSGTVGPEAATQLVGFLRIESKMPDVRRIRKAPMEVEIPLDPTICYALCAALGASTEPKDADNVFTYIRRLRPDYQIVFATILRGKQPDTVETDAYVQWATTSSANAA